MEFFGGCASRRAAPAAPESRPLKTILPPPIAAHRSSLQVAGLLSPDIRWSPWGKSRVRLSLNAAPVTFVL